MEIVELKNKEKLEKINCFLITWVYYNLYL